MKREKTIYRDDELLFSELLFQASNRPGARLFSRSGCSVVPTPEELRERERQAAIAKAKAEVKAAEKQRREAERNALILVYCTACGTPKTGPRLELAKFRKCCDAPATERKFCRGCGTVITREEYFARGGNKIGWGTYAKCAPCGTLHRAPIRWCKECKLEHELVEGHNR